MITRTEDIIKLVVSLAVIYALPLISHLPICKLNKSEKKTIKMYGLVHFTSQKNAENIIKSGMLIGKKSNMDFIEKKLGPLVWTFYPENIETKSKWLNKKAAAKKDPKCYEVCLLLKDFSDRDIDKMRKLIGFRNQIIVFKGIELKCNISVLETQKIQKKDEK